MDTPSKEQWLAAFQVALAAALAAIANIFATAPDAQAAADAAAAYLREKFAPEVIARLASGLPQEVVAAILTGQSEVYKPPSNLA